MKQNKIDAFVENKTVNWIMFILMCIGTLLVAFGWVVFNPVDQTFIPFTIGHIFFTGLFVICCVIFYCGTIYPNMDVRVKQ